MLEPSTGTMHGMVGGEARDTTERCVCGVCTRETQGRRTERECQRLQNRRFTLVIFPHVFIPTRKNHASVVQGPRPKGDHTRKRRPQPTHDTRVTNTPDQPNRQAQTDVPRLKVRTSLRPPMNKFMWDGWEDTSSLRLFFPEKETGLKT